MTFLEVLWKDWHRAKLLKEGDRVVVGLSGGADSVFLLYCLEKARKTLKLSLTVAHFNHCLRREESEEDEKFVISLCEGWHLPLRIERWEGKKEGGPISEEKAREARYAFFERVCREVGADKVALAHTQDDDVETILFRLLRGSGLSGLRGIPFERPLGPYRLIRPLKEMSREAIRDFLRKEEIPWREDASNGDIRYTRNRIRHHLLPLLEKEFNPKIREILLHLGENVTEDYDYLQKEGDSAFEKVVVEQNRRQMVYKRRVFQAFPFAIQKQLFRQALRKLGTNMDRVGYSEWKALSELLEKKTFRYTLPGALKVKGTPTKLVFQKEIWYS